MITASVYDIRTHRIPNLLILAGGIVGILIMVINGNINITGTLLELLCLFVFSFFNLMGMGDVKFWMMITIFIPLRYSAFGVAAGAAILIVYGLIKEKRYVPNAAYPFAPFMSAGVIMAEIARFMNVL